MSSIFMLEVNNKLVRCIVNEPYSSELECLHFEVLSRLKSIKSSADDSTAVEEVKRAREELASKIVKLGEYEVL